MLKVSSPPSNPSLFHVRLARCAFTPAAALLCGSSLLLAGCGGSHSNNNTDAGYTFTNFDYTNTTGGTFVTGISNDNVAVGYNTAPLPPYPNFERTSNGNITTVNLATGVLKGLDPLANAVNNSGTIVGLVGSNAFVYQNAAPSLLPPIDANTTAEVAVGINDAGTIVGNYNENNSSSTLGFLYANGTYTSINPASSVNAAAVSSFANGINNNGVVVGSYTVAGTTVEHGFVYNSSTKQFTFPPDPNTSRITSGGLVAVFFMAVNDQNIAAGYYQTNNGSQYGFLYNLANQSYTYIDNPQATTATVNGTNTGVQITTVNGINNTGEIVGSYVDSNDARHGFTAN